MRLIDADALLAECKEAQESDPNADGRGWANHFLNAAGKSSAEWYFVEDMIENTPTIDAVPVVHGKWEHGREVSREYIGSVITSIFYENWHCSACGYTIDDRWYSAITYKYCPNCGARMDGPETEEVSGDGEKVE